VHLVRSLQNAGGALNQQIDRLQLRLMNASTHEVKPTSHVKRIAPTYEWTADCEDADMSYSEASCNPLNEDEDMSNALDEENDLNTRKYDALGHRIDRVQTMQDRFTHETLESTLYEPNATWPLHSDIVEDSQTKNLFDDGSESDDQLNLIRTHKESNNTENFAILLGQCDQVSSQKEECELVNDSYVNHVVFHEMKSLDNATNCLLYCMSPFIKSLFKVSVLFLLDFFF
jgi:hypothetical protein